MKTADLMVAILQVSEKAAKIARLIRSEKDLFELLVEEKTGDSKNKRFVQDFKTLADVLVQETVRHDVGQQFPLVASSIYGEESNQFTNTMGETIIVEVKSQETETRDLLVTVLDGNQHAATLLAKEVHQAIKVETPSELSGLELEIADDNIGVWIDPIDSTAQYIRGDQPGESQCGVKEEGLESVTVLIGAYDKTSGLPILGVINQPFSSFSADSNSWQGRYSWGVAHKDIKVYHHEQNQSSRSTKAVTLSSSESQQVQDKLKKQFTLCYAPGAGYKMLCVVDSLVDAYILSRGSTFKWDSCGPHALLRAMGGGVKVYQKGLAAVQGKESQEEIMALLEKYEVTYQRPDSTDLKGGQKWSNAGGLIAYLDAKVLVELIHMLSE